MANQHHQEELNRLLIDLVRSLLQYVGECWPWLGYRHQAEHERIDELVALQQKHIGWLVDLLSRRNWQMDFGTYPTEYTDLHYVALEYLLKQVVASEEGLVAEIEELVQGLSDDVEAVEVLQKILAGERDILNQLREMLQPEAAAGTPA